MIMKFLKFNINGSLALFRRGTSVDDTTELVLTHDYMPPTALKGLIGAIIGYSGLAKASRENTKIEFLKKLDGVKIAVLPNRTNKFIQRITNTTGFANSGSTMIMAQQVLEDLSYEVLVGDNFDDYEKLKDFMFKGKTVYPLTLGRKGFTASYSNVEEIESGLYTDSNFVKGFMSFEKVGEISDDEEYAHVELPVDYNEHFMYEYKDYVVGDLIGNYGGEFIEFDGEKISVI